MVEVMGADDPGTLFTLSNLAYFLAKSETDGPDSLDRAERLYEELVQRRRRVLGPTHPHTLDTLRNWARVQGEIGGAHAAASAYQRLLEKDLHPLEATNPLRMATELDYATALAEAGELAGTRSVVSGLAARMGERPDRERIMATIGEYGDVEGSRRRIDRLHAALASADADAEEPRAITMSWVAALG